jgi:hypothetical protein
MMDDHGSLDTIIPFHGLRLEFGVSTELTMQVLFSAIPLQWSVSPGFSLLRSFHSVALIDASMVIHYQVVLIEQYRGSIAT